MQIRRSFEFAAKEFGFAVATFAEIPSRPDLVSKSISFHEESIRPTAINKSHFPEFGDHVPLGAMDSIQYLSRTLDGMEFDSGFIFASRIHFSRPFDSPEADAPSPCAGEYF